MTGLAPAAESRFWPQFKANKLTFLKDGAPSRQRLACDVRSTVTFTQAISSLVASVSNNLRELLSFIFPSRPFNDFTLLDLPR